MSKTDTYEPCLLLAMPQLSDPNFFQTISIITNFSRDGALGLVLNRPINIEIEAIDHSNRGLAHRPIGAFWGGPIQTDLGLVIHCHCELAEHSQSIGSGFYLSGSQQVLEVLIDKAAQGDSRPFRLYLGYAGWDAGQLEHELSQSSWITMPLSIDIVFSREPAKLWQYALATMGLTLHQLITADQPLMH